MKTFLSVLPGMIFLTACSYQKMDKTSPSINAVMVDENFCINLLENHVTGYTWQINPHFNNKILDYYGSVFRGNEKGVEFNFRTMNAGKDTLNFALIKYRDTIETKQFIIEIRE